MTSAHAHRIPGPSAGLHRTTILGCILAVAALASAGEEAKSVTPVNSREVAVGNLVYAGTKSSRCFSDAFLTDVRSTGSVNVAKGFTVVKAAQRSELGAVGFAVMTGEGAFTLTTPERDALKRWLEDGGFLVASAGCSSPEWAASFRKEATAMFGAKALVAVGAEHPVFSTLTDVRASVKAGKARYEGIILDGRLACLFSRDGLNDTHNVKGCCCCGGSEVKDAKQILANALVYALVE